MSSSVKLYVYDLSNGLARQLSRHLTGRQIDGIWHTSVVIFGKEYFYGQGINITLPGQSHHGSPLQILDMGQTSIDENTFDDYITEVREHYTADKYHLLDFNCNSFTNDVVGFLTGNSIPDFIKDLPTDFLSTPFGASLRPTIDAMFNPSRGALPTPPSASILESASARAQANNVAAYVPGNAQGHATDSLSGAVHVITNQSSFRSFLNTHKAAVAFFTSSTCGPCRMIEPVFMEIAQSKGVKSQVSARNGVGFAKIDIGVGLGRSLAAQWRVTATPTFMFFCDGTKVQEIKGADSTELKTQVDLLLFQAYPPHSHTNLSLPFIQKISFNPILFTRIPAIDAVIAKLDAFIDSTTWPDNDKTQVKSLIKDTISPYFKARFATGAKLQGQSPSASSAMLSSWSQASSKIINALPTESLFPMIDLWRLLVLDPATETWVMSQPNFDQHPLSLLLASTEYTVASSSRNYILTLLRLFANIFASPLIAQRLVLGSQKQKLTALIIQTLLHDDAVVKNASASLIFNYSAALQKNRVDFAIGTTMRGTSIPIDEDEDWEVEMVSAIIEALRREKENEEFVHRLSAALAFIVRLSPFWSSLQTVLQVLQCKEVLESKLSGTEGWSKSGGVGQKSGARMIIQEADQNALLNNQRLFDVYAKKLCSSDAGTFSDVTEKLSSWLNNPKAYYKEARPEIIKMLTVAQTTVQDAVGPTNPAEPFHVSQYKEHPLVPPYIRLIQVVRQYMNLFVEQDLGACIRQLVSTVSVPLPLPTKAPTQEIHTALASSRQEAKVAQSTLPNISNTPITSSTALKRDATLVAAAASSSSSLSESGKPKPVTDSITATTPLQGASQRVKRKRKTIDHLIDVDQKRFRLSMASGQANVVSSGSNKEVDAVRPTGADVNLANTTGTSENAVPHTSPQVTSVLTEDATAVRPDSPRQSFVDKTIANEASIIASEEHLMKGSEDQHQSVESRHTTLSQNVTGVPTQDMGSAMSVISDGDKADISTEPLQINTEHTLSYHGDNLEFTTSELASSEQAHEDESAMPANSEAVEESGDDAMQVDSVEEQLVREQADNVEERLVREQVDNVEEQLVREQVDNVEEQLVREQADNVEERLVREQVDNVEEQLVQEQVAPKADDMESDNATSFQEQVVKGIQRLHARLSQCASLLPHPGQDIESKISQDQDDITFHPGENVSDETGMLAAGPLGQGESPIQIDEPTSHKVGSPEVDLPEAPKSDLNGLSAVHQSPEKIKVPTLIRGLLHPGTVKIDFDIKVGIHSALLRWTRRLSPMRNVNDAICVSLGCYNATETALKAVSSKSGRDWRDFISSHQPSWPQTGGLQLLLNGGKRYDLPLSPPLTTQDGLVDLSPYLVEGANGIELHSTRDMSKYVFALVLHPPTPGQLAWKSEQCKMEKDWKDWIKILTQPFNLNPVPFKR